MQVATENSPVFIKFERNSLVNRLDRAIRLPHSSVAIRAGDMLWFHAKTDLAGGPWEENQFTKTLNCTNYGDIAISGLQKVYCLSVS